jgi:hypothetical protein
MLQVFGKIKNSIFVWPFEELEQTDGLATEHMSLNCFIYVFAGKLK